MIAERNYSPSHFPFTASQWQELEQQVLTFRYLTSGLPVPPALMSTVITTSSKSSPSSLFPLHQQQPLPIGLGCFQVGYERKIDAEPGRCRRTDGKKWRCSKEAHPDSKYCERHMHRSKSKAKKHFDVFNGTSVSKTPSNHGTATTSPTMKSCLPYPALSCSASPSQNIRNFSCGSKVQTDGFYPFLPAQSSSLSSFNLSNQGSNTGNHWLDLDGEFHAQRVRDIRDIDEMKGRIGEKMLNSEGAKVNSYSSECSDFPGEGAGYENYRGIVDEERGVRVDKEHESQKLFHHFLGDWPMKRKSSQSHAAGILSRTSK